MPLLMSVLFDLVGIFASVRFAGIVSTIPGMCKQYQGSAWGPRVSQQTPLFLCRISFAGIGENAWKGKMSMTDTEQSWALSRRTHSYERLAPHP
jgi:hypothetical protein